MEKEQAISELYKARDLFMKALLDASLLGDIYVSSTTIANGSSKSGEPLEVKITFHPVKLKKIELPDKYWENPLVTVPTSAEEKAG